MESLYILIPIALVFCIIAIKLLLWAIDNGQYDDLDKEAWSIISDDPVDPTEGAPIKTAKPHKTEQEEPMPSKNDNADVSGRDD